MKIKKNLVFLLYHGFDKLTKSRAYCRIKVISFFNEIGETVNKTNSYTRAYSSFYIEVLMGQYKYQARHVCKR